MVGPMPQPCSLSKVVQVLVPGTEEDFSRVPRQTPSVKESAQCKL